MSDHSEDLTDASPIPQIETPSAIEHADMQDQIVAAIAVADEPQTIDPTRVEIEVKPRISVDLTLSAQIESLLYVASEPVPINALATALDASNKEIEAALKELDETYAQRGMRLQRMNNRVQLVTAPEMASQVQKFLGLESINRLSNAAVETLAIIAYRQPITKPQIEMLRGVNCDGVMHTLEARNLIQELGRADTVGHPMRYGVTFDFLQYFGLQGTLDLPQIQNIETLPVQPAPPLITASNN